MRKIKFRAWHKEQKKMYSAEEMGEDQLTLMPDGRGFANIDSVSTKLSQIDNNRKMIPLQFTGLHDKNGKEIYEGDIIHKHYDYFTDPADIGGKRHIVGDYYFPIEFKQGCFGHSQDKAFNLFTPLMKVNLGNWEVIGNIYENPELLNEAK